MSQTQDLKLQDIAIVAAKRTAVGKFAGTISKISASDLGATVIKDILANVNIEAELINEVIMGQVLTAGCGQNPARQALIKAGLPKEIPAFTINKVCGSGLKSVILGVQAILSGDAEIVIAGGQESMSSSPHILQNSRDGTRMGNALLIDSMINDGLWDIFNNYHMGITAENVAKKFNISREEQDAFAVHSQNKAETAQKNGSFDEEITPIIIPQKKGEPIIFKHDEGVRLATSIEQLEKLKPAFDKAGSVTAGNSSGINDGAAAVMLMSVEKAKALGLPILATIKAFATSGLEPEIMGMGPVHASKKCLQRAGWEIENIDLLEVNEAFAAQAIAVNKAMGWDTTKINVNGGAIAIGHPIGASGCRILVTLIHEMQRRKAKAGLASLCIGGGMGIALAIENTYSN
jgi:acetyl-CoA C-acetyltransferase